MSSRQELANAIRVLSSVEVGVWVGMGVRSGFV